MTLASLALVTSALLPFSDKPYRTETVVYARPDGKALKATLYLPKAEPAGLRPAIVLIHGGAWATGSRRQVYWYGRQFASHGYVAMSVSYRTMPGASFPAPVHDVKAAVRWLRAHADEWHIDSDRVAAMGTSAGGHLALMLALTAGEKDLEGEGNTGYSSEVQAAISLYGPADLGGFAKQDTAEGSVTRYLWEPYLKKFVGTKEVAGREPIEAASPITYVKPDAPPILCIHGTEDSVVPVEQSESIADKLRASGVPAECIAVPGRGHAFDYLHPSVRRELFPKILAFLDKHLDGGNVDAEDR